MNNAWSELSDSIVRLVEYAGALAQRTRSDLKVEHKPDLSLVTNIDRNVENFLSEQLVKLLPGSNVWGEESGFHLPSEKGLWIIDPIDGTSNFIYGFPLWGVSVALYFEEKIVLGVVCLPDLGEVFSASIGGGCLLNGKKLSQIVPGEIKPFELVSCPETILCYSHIRKWPGKMRYTGAFVVDGTYVACQRLRGLVGFNAKLYDIAAVVCMVRELGGDVRYLDGGVFSESELVKDEKISRPFLMFPKDSNFYLEYQSSYKSSL